MLRDVKRLGQIIRNIGCESGARYSSITMFFFYVKPRWILYIYWAISNYWKMICNISPTEKAVKRKWNPPISWSSIAFSGSSNVSEWNNGNWWPMMMYKTSNLFSNGLILRRAQGALKSFAITGTKAVFFRNGNYCLSSNLIWLHNR